MSEKDKVREKYGRRKAMSWETIVSMVRDEDRLLAATLALVYVDTLTWTDTHVSVFLLAKQDSFAAEQLQDGGIKKAEDVAGRILGTPVRISFRVVKKEDIFNKGARLLSMEKINE